MDGKKHSSGDRILPYYMLKPFNLSDSEDRHVSTVQQNNKIEAVVVEKEQIKQNRIVFAEALQPRKVTFYLKLDWDKDTDDDDDDTNYQLKTRKDGKENFLTHNLEKTKAEAAAIFKRMRDLKLGASKAVTIQKTALTEKYKPIGYLDLFQTNDAPKNLLHWFKIWDRFVYGDDYLLKVRATQLKRGGTPNRILECYDETERPAIKIALLAGPPGSGKTAAAYVVAKQAGYRVIEVNASDDRSVVAIKNFLAATQMHSRFFYGKDEAKPQCLVLDEIDGMTKEAIAVLLKAAQGGKGKKKCKLFRPVVCICNDPYVKNLIELRKYAHLIKFEPVSSASLDDRLGAIIKKERIDLNFMERRQLVGESGGDIRACLVALEFYCTVKQFGLVSQFVDTLRVPNIFEACGQMYLKTNDPNKVERTVQNYGNYRRLSNVLFGDYLKRIGKGTFLDTVGNVLSWFNWYEQMSGTISREQNYTLYPYMPVPFVGIHQIIACWSARSTVPFDLTGGATSLESEFMEFRKALVPTIGRFLHTDDIVLDVLPYVSKIVQPVCIPVLPSVCWTPAQKDTASHAVSVMMDFNLRFTAENNVYQLQPAFVQPHIFMPEGEKEQLPKRNIVHQQLDREIQNEHIKQNHLVEEITVNKNHAEAKPSMKVKRLLPGINIFAPKNAAPASKRKLIDPRDDEIWQLYAKATGKTAVNPGVLAKRRKIDIKQPPMSKFFSKTNLTKNQIIDKAIQALEKKTPIVETATSSSMSTHVVNHAPDHLIYQFVSDHIENSKNKNQLCRKIGSICAGRKYPENAEAIRKILERLPREKKLRICEQYNIPVDKFFGFFHKDN